MVELRSSTDWPATAELFVFCPMRKMDASEGRRGDDLCDSPGVVPYGEFGCLSRLDAMDSGPMLVFRRRDMTECGLESRCRFSDESVLAEIDEDD